MILQNDATQTARHALAHAMRIQGLNTPAMTSASRSDGAAPQKQQSRVKKVIFRLESRFFSISIRGAQKSSAFESDDKHF